jgi:predicted RNase H-like nuclease (RuvC/YqgF family)
VTISPATAARPTGAAAQILTDSESEERNMNLEQLREMMDTDARKRAEAQEQTIKELHKRIAELRAENEQLKQQLMRRIDNPPGFDQERGSRRVS